MRRPSEKTDLNELGTATGIGGTGGVRDNKDGPGNGGGKGRATGHERGTHVIKGQERQVCKDFQSGFLRSPAAQLEWSTGHEIRLRGARESGCRPGGHAASSAPKKDAWEV
ncbi:hypothetical protein B0H13DRAFT_1856119 [Mycena leptocephala]|nr:hypothetical protein B0H13DRAFT_1856119 [Mycena leptocephala]